MDDQMLVDNDAEPAAGGQSRRSSVGAQHRDGEHGVIDCRRTTSIFASLSSLLLSEKFSDMTIRCGGREFKAHRAIVCPQSPFFDKALTSGFKETSTGIVELPEDDPDVLVRFLQFLYTGTYENGPSGFGPPAEASMMSPEEVAEELQTAPGVTVAAKAMPGGKSHHDTEDGEDDGNYSTSSQFNDGEDPEEPEEQYNEYYEPSEAGSDTADVRVGRSLEKIKLMKPPHLHWNQWTDMDADEKQRVLELHRREDLFMPLRLYIMADKFDVPALRLLARDRFYRTAEKSWAQAECFPDVVDELYSGTCPTDIALREIVCRLVATRIRDNEQRARMDAVLRKHGDFAVGVMNYMVESERLTWT